MNLKINKNNLYLIFSLLGVIIVLRQLLTSGYVLTLDMVFGPRVAVAESVGNLLNTLPIWYLLHFLTLVLGGWLTQKLLLILIFFLLFYLPLRFFKKIFMLEDTHGEEFVAALIFAINPFVYERFLAGQWMIILSYSLFVPLMAYLIEFCHKENIRNSLKLFGVIILLEIISIHLFIIALIIIAFVWVIIFFSHRLKTDFLKRSLILGLFILLFSGYWLMPVVLSKTAPLDILGSEHWTAFKTAGQGNFGVLANVLTLHGFWEEHESWIKKFILPKEGGFIFGVSFAFLFFLVLLGISVGLKDKQLRPRILLMISVLCFSVIFSCGVGEGVFKNFNLWLFENVYFWRGFRDTEKWSAVLALLYALFAGLGSRRIILWFQKPEYRKIVLYVLLLIPLIYTPVMLWGFASQLRTVQYPESWAKINNILKLDKNCRALFLPWQQYYYLRFNNSMLTVNLSGNYFDCDIVHGKNMELGIIRSQGGNGEEYDAIERVVINNWANPDDTIAFLKQKGIKYIIFTTDIVPNDYYKYPFINSKYIHKITDEGDIYLYRVL